jgi:Domain of unknown function (DUF4389)
MDMTDISPPSWAAPDAPSGPFGRAPIQLAVAERTGQRRLTVLLRIVLLIPQWIALWALGIAAEVIAVIGWFGALFTGRLPQFAEAYLSGYLHWQVRVSAYQVLLTDAYPPFTLGDSDYPVRVAIPPAGPLNRLAVLFRLILAVPAAIVSGLLVWGGWTIILFIAWLIMLVTGTMPASLYQAYAAVLRYSTRYLGYLLMLTSEYPSEIFGDRLSPGQLAVAQGTAGIPADGLPGSPPQPASEPGGFPAEQLGQAEAPGYPAEPGAQPGPPADPAQPANYPTEPGGQPGASPGQSFPGQSSPGQSSPGQSFPGQPATVPAGPGSFGSPAGQPQETAPFAQPAVGSPGQLVLSDGARKLVGLFLALGVILIVAYIVVIAVVVNSAANSTVTRNNAITQVQASYGTLSRALSSFQARSSACQGNLQCVTALDRQASQAFDAFGTSVRGTAMPNGATTTAAGRLVTASLAAGQLLQRLGSATTAAQYEAIINSTDVQQILNQVDANYQNLGTQLNTP